jgi:hypothetical protein
MVRKGIDGTSHQETLMCCVARSVVESQDHVLDVVLSDLLSKPSSGALVISRHFDPTPVKVLHDIG